jgi:hypothetical protein
MTDRWLLVVGFGVMGLCLSLVAYQTVLVSHMLERIATLIVATH